LDTGDTPAAEARRVAVSGGGEMSDRRRNGKGGGECLRIWVGEGEKKVHGQ